MEELAKSLKRSARSSIRRIGSVVADGGYWGGRRRAPEMRMSPAATLGLVPRFAGVDCG
jgi:hypothetical protein